MKRFISRLSPLLRLRQQQEKLAALQMAEATRQAEQAQQELRQQQAEQQAAHRATTEILRAQPAGGLLHAGRAHLQWQAVQVAMRQQTVQNRQQQRDMAGRRRTAAWQDLRVAERARQKEREQYLLLLQREQTADIVDRASQDSLAKDNRPSPDNCPIVPDATIDTDHSADGQTQESPS